MYKFFSFLVSFFASFIKAAVSSLVICTGVAAVAYYGPKAYTNLMYNANMDDVLYVSVKLQNGYTIHGTGFHILKPDGTMVLLTNAHICNDSAVLYTAIDVKGVEYLTRVIKKSKDTDLCILTPIKNKKPFRLTTRSFYEEPLFSIGWPSNYPILISEGKLVGWVNTRNEGNVLQTTIQVRHGNSGSPVLDISGRVVGIVYAMDEGSWAKVISSQDIINFIK